MSEPKIILTTNNSLKRKIDYSINLLKKSEDMALRLDPENGFYLAFSGGKDSQVLYHIAKMAGVKFKAHMNLTSVDPPDVIRFVKKEYPEVEFNKPKISMYDMAIKKKILPTKTIRWCCAEYKEKSGAGKVTLIGIRHEESVRRSKRKEVSINTKGKRKEMTFDQWSEHEEKMVTCVEGKDRILVSPIIHWTEKDVWSFLNSNNIPHCSLYDEGYRRIGCILCPMSSYKLKIQECNRFPHAKHKWLKTIHSLIDRGYYKKGLGTPEFVFQWWISGKSFNKFYADEVMQLKLEL